MKQPSNWLWCFITGLLYVHTVLAHNEPLTVKRFTNSTLNGTLTVEQAREIIAKAQLAMEIANELKLQHPVFNTYEFGNTSTSEVILAPPLDYESVTNDTLSRKRSRVRRSLNETTNTNSTEAYTYSIPAELALAARIVAEAEPGSPSDENQSGIAAEIKARYALKSPDTRKMPQAILRPNGLYSHVDSLNNLDIENLGNNETSAEESRAVSTYWMATIQQTGVSPFAPAGYKVRTIPN